MKETREPSLRDRKRQSTRRRLERAAVDIALADGLDRLTIDAISERAEVSSRTFFNYFDSKEDAILGIRLASDLTAELEASVADLRPASLRDGVLTLFEDYVEDADHSPDLREARRRLVHRHPELLHRRFEKMGTMMGALTDAVFTLMQRTAPAEGRELTRSHARIVLMACGMAVHSALMEMSCDKGPPPDGSLGPAVRARADQLLNETMGLLT